MVRARTQTLCDGAGTAKPREEPREERRSVYALAPRGFGSAHSEVGPHVRHRQGVLRKDVGLQPLAVVVAFEDHRGGEVDYYDECD